MWKVGGQGMSQAVELYEKDGRATGFYFCSTCRIVYATKDKADWCHGEHLCACGKRIPQHERGRTCSECQSKEWREKDAKKEAERFEAATKITEAEYKGEHVYCGDKYYDSVEDAVDGYLAGQEPEYVWACKEHGIPTIDLEDVTTNILDNMWEDADTSDLNGIDELEAALALFNKANDPIQLWEPDYSTAILVEKAVKG